MTVVATMSSSVSSVANVVLPLLARTLVADGEDNTNTTGKNPSYLNVTTEEEDIITTCISAFALVFGVLMVVIGLPLLARLVSPNRCCGVGFMRLKRNPAQWYDVNQRMGTLFVIFGVILVAVSEVFFVLPYFAFHIEARAGIVAGYILLSLLIILIATRYKLNSVADEYSSTFEAESFHDDL
eukprot:TRINITY_DN5318_c0_g1_i1.p1 TRINITY_DN5318_c0_g1~~TRINITY_DN5318_c0_g1_i1.p1  ORF type:complete len:183 (-),score=27.92 TRINITY_DN5318_c0_g1_i1:109-657(-)